MMAGISGRSPILGVVLLLAVALPLEPQVPPVVADPYQISVNVNLVMLQATVHDRRGQYVSSLHEPDFEVFEDGVRQALRVFRHEDVPVTVGLVVDHSGSMRHKLADVTSAAGTFVRASNPEDQMFVVNFNEHVTMALPAGLAFSNRSDVLEAAILKTLAAGQTALYDAVVAGLDRLQAGDRQRRALIVISDGGDNASSHRLPQMLQKAGQSTAPVYTIGIFDEDDPDRNPDVLRRLSKATGGEAYFPRKPEDIVSACERIARDIRSQYSLGYVSSNAAKPGAWRAIRVEARHPGESKLSVRARAGYFSQ